jgi:tetratricopeptide (TPR) repeat protein
VDPSAAVGDFDEALRLNPRSLPALQNRAAALSGVAGGDEEALSTLTRAAALYPDLAEIHSGRARMLAALGRRDQAIEASDAALSLSHSPHILYQVGCAYAINCGTHPEDRDQALRLVSRALRNGFGHRELPVDEDLKPLRDDPRFVRLLKAAREKSVATEGR